MSMSVTLGEALQMILFVLTVVGAYWRLSVRVTKNEGRLTTFSTQIIDAQSELKRLRGLYDRVIRVETVLEVHAEMFGKLEHVLERIERKLDDKADKRGS